MANKEIEKEAKKAYIAQIKLAEIIREAVNCQPRPSYLGHLTKGVTIMRNDQREQKPSEKANTSANNTPKKTEAREERR